MNDEASPLDLKPKTDEGAKVSRAVDQNRDLWERVFIAAIPDCLRVNAWTDASGNPIKTSAARVGLAAEVADRAVTAHKARFGD